MPSRFRLVVILTEAAIKRPCVRRHRLRSAVGSKPLTMGNTSKILQRLYSLDNPSPDLLRHLLHHLIKHDEEEEYLTGLKEPKLTRMLDFLDKVRAVPSTLRRFRNRLL